MYDSASWPAFTRVSVPVTGSENESSTTKLLPTTLPSIRPITSSVPPEHACITIFSSATALIFTDLK